MLPTTQPYAVLARCNNECLFCCHHGVARSAWRLVAGGQSCSAQCRHVTSCDGEPEGKRGGKRGNGGRSTEVEIELQPPPWADSTCSYVTVADAPGCRNTLSKATMSELGLGLVRKGRARKAMTTSAPATEPVLVTVTDTVALWQAVSDVGAACAPAYAKVV